MKTKMIEVCDGYHIDISCEYNDSVDVKAGGPAMLGYDFYVSSDENIEELKTFLENCIKKYNRPFISILHRKAKDVAIKNIWTREEMEECIKNNGF